MTIQNVAGHEGIPTESSEVRYFTPTDSAEAQRIAKEVAPFFGSGGIIADLPEGMPYVSHARQYEIWFSSAFRLLQVPCWHTPPSLNGRAAAGLTPSFWWPRYA